MKKGARLVPVDKWNRCMQNGVLVVKRSRREYVHYANLPYIIHNDFKRLAHLVHLWDRAMRHDKGKEASATLNSLSGQCETLYYKVYGSVCYFGDVPANLISKY